MDNRHQKDIFSSYEAITTLTVYRGILKDPMVARFKDLLKAALKNRLNMDIVTKSYSFFYHLIMTKEATPGPQRGSIWQDHILDLLLIDENPFSLKCESKGLAGVETPLQGLVKKDLRALKSLYDFDFSAFEAFLIERLSLNGIAFPEIYEIHENKSYPHPENYFLERDKLKKLLMNSKDWSIHIEDLALFYHKVGCGQLGRYWGFKWSGDELVGISQPDPIRLSELIGYEEQKQEVLRNTTQFVKGFGANNMLLYGDRGTGKSSTIKALLHEFGKDGLRIVEVSKDQLMYLQPILSQLRQRPQRFIIFVDDLSFEEHETEYKHLKAILEGSLESAPENVKIYATSNRRHLIREFHRDEIEDEKKAQDTLQEKLSLSDRFGITVVYLSPNHDKYLEIVEGIAKNKGIEVDKEKLRKMAIQWELWQNQRSGRTAKQFIEDLIGKLEMKNQK